MAAINGSRAPLIAFLIVLAGVGYETFRMAAPFLLPLVLGAIFAVMARPAYRRIRARGLGPRTAAVAVTTGVFFLVVVPLSLVVVRAAGQAGRVFSGLRDSGELSVAGMTERLRDVPVARRMARDPDELRRYAKDFAERSSGAAAAAVAKAAKGIPRFLIELALAVVALYFFLVDGPRFVDWLLERSTLDAEVRQRVVRDLHGTALATVWASLATATAQSLTVMLGFWATGVPAPLLAGCAAFILAWVPIIHTTPVILSGLAYLYVQGETGRLIGLLFAGAITGVIDNVVRALVLKHRHNMHPLVGLVSVLGGMQLFGIVGVFLGPILAALFISLLDLWPTLAARSGVEIE
ncbi:MAG: AI-2E family transporter [Elusimicrobia bacterium]|nr:AI-2E family transporter [Elusimicrobiota bacterium]